jgi:hypothetical protein
MSVNGETLLAVTIVGQYLVKGPNVTIGRNDAVLDLPQHPAMPLMVSRQMSGSIERRRQRGVVRRLRFFFVQFIYNFNKFVK